MSDTVALATAGAVLTGAILNYLRHRAASTSKAAPIPSDTCAPEAVVEGYSERFGKACRSLFALDFDSGFTHVNHGSYGTAPKAVIQAASEQMLRIESFPDQFMRREALSDYKRVCEEVGSFVGAPAKSTVLVENATTGVNAVLNSIPFQAGDVIVLNDMTYNACRLAVENVAKRHGCVIKTLSIPLPVGSDDELVEVFERQLQALSAELGKGKRFARFMLLDHIASPTALLFPLAKLLPLCKGYSELVMVDGAHAPGMLHPLDIASYAALGCDYYTGNLHKWCFAMKGVAFLFVRPELQRSQQPLVISHLTLAEDWRDRFFMQGTNDQSRYLAVPAALQFMRVVGGKLLLDMYSYNHSLCLAATAMLCKLWGEGTNPLLPSASLSAPFMRSIKTPLDFRYFLTAVQDQGRLLDTLSDTEALKLAMEDPRINERVATAIFTASGVQGQFVFWPTASGGAIYSRISCQLYNCMDDYARLGKAVLELAAKVDAEIAKQHAARAW